MNSLQSNSDPFFIVGCPRSGTTAVAEILQGATNAQVSIEQRPTLCWATRAHTEGLLYAPTEYIGHMKRPQIEAVIQRGMLYGDKNPNYGYFIPQLRSLWRARFVFVVRDGTAAVRSMMDWHNLMGKQTYGRSEDTRETPDNRSDLSDWDLCRLRPQPGDEHYDGWRDMSRFQKCAWFWANYNARVLGHLAVDNVVDDWTLVDMSRVDVDRIAQLYEWLGLEGFDSGRTRDILIRRVNSIHERTGQPDQFLHFINWTPQMVVEFGAVANGMMERLGYYR